MKQIMQIPGILAFLFMGIAVHAQFNRQSIVQYQMDGLALNPAYAGAAGATSFEAFYFGNFDNLGTLSRSAVVSVHGPSYSGDRAFGGVLEFFKTGFTSEVALQPAFAFLRPAGNGTLSFGAGIGIRYFDFDDDGFGGAPANFAVLEESAGAMFRNDRFFAGLSAANFYELSLRNEDLGSPGVVPRDAPISLTAGGLWQVHEDLILKPAFLVQTVKRHFLSDDAVAAPADTRYTNLEFLPSVIVQETYLIGLLMGVSDFDDGSRLNRIGLSITLNFDNFHMGYALVRNSNNQNLELPTSHMISAGYTFAAPDQSGTPKFF
ncbi:MAG: hypothetical protein CMN32_01820 [Saprospirales bacterium]|nr:hypothetical protein [Saprospirales bacterium]